MSYFAKPNGQPNFDANHMLMVHDMFRREFTLIPGVVGRVAAGDHDPQIVVSPGADGCPETGHELRPVGLAGTHPAAVTG